VASNIRQALEVGDVPKYAAEVGGDAQQKSGGGKKKGGGSGKNKGAGGKKVRPRRCCPPRHGGQGDNLVPPIHAVEAAVSLSPSARHVIVPICRPSFLELNGVT